MTIEEGRARLRQAILYLPPEDHSLIEQAAHTAVRAHEGQRRTDGSPYATHPLAVALILAEWKADAETIAAGLLHDVLEDTACSFGDIKGTFGRAVASLVEGVTKFTQADFAGETSLDRKTETLRKLFEVMRRDIRVVLIKLADRLHNVRTIDALPPERRPRFAKETLDIYSKLAYHLGMNDLRREFSECCMSYVHPEHAEDLRRFRESTLAKGTKILQEMKQRLDAVDTEGVLLSLQMHPRSLSSLEQEQRETGGMKQGFALIAIARDHDACYALLKIFHTLYRPLSGEFHDYIAAPTESAYQSIRTMVLGPRNELVPLRIRTAAMDEQEQRGVLLWCFPLRPALAEASPFALRATADRSAGKQGFGGQVGQKEKRIPAFSWLLRSESLDHATRESSEAFFQALQSDIFQETVGVVVDGKEIHLPRHATVLDALYARHGKNAGHTYEVRVNGKEAKLGDVLAGEEVIVASADTRLHVSFDWLDFIETTYAHTLIVDALKERGHTEKVTLGQRLLQKELDYEQRGIIGEIPKARLQDAARHFRRENFEEVLSLIGEGVLQARDVVFHLFPERRRLPLFRQIMPSFHAFRLHIRGTAERQQDVLPKLYALTKLAEVEMKKTDLRFDPMKKTYDLYLQGRAPDRLHFADFLSLLDRQNWTSRIVTLISHRQKFTLAASLVSAFAVILVDILLLPRYPLLLPERPFASSLFLQVFPLLPILWVNYYLLRLLRHYVARMRTDRWFLGIAFLLNIVGLLLVILQSAFTSRTPPSLFPFLALFVASMFYLGYRFFQTETLFTPIDRQSLIPMTPEQWRVHLRRKLIGYCIRLCAVIIWGFQPLYLKYTPAHSVTPFMQLYLMNIGAASTTILLALFQKTFASRRPLTLKIPWNIYLLQIVIGQAFFLYFISASLLYTTSTNFALLSNFSPVFALLAAVIFWRHSIPYLRNPRHMLWIFLIFLMGSTGGSLIIYHSIQFGNSKTILGDILALCAMVADVLVITSQIRYIRLIPKASSLSLNMYMFGPTTLILTPLILFLATTWPHTFAFPSSTSIMFSLGVGVLLAIGMVCNFEAFRRIDGFIAFLMFNISILINFIAEAFFLKTIMPTWILVIGGTIIIGSTILAELINSHCERRGV